MNNKLTKILLIVAIVLLVIFTKPVEIRYSKNNYIIINESGNNISDKTIKEATEEDNSIEVQDLTTIKFNDGTVIKREKVLREKVAEVKEKRKEEKIASYDWKDGYIDGTDVNIRKKPKMDSEKLKTVTFNDHVEYVNYNKHWVMVKLSYKEVGYVRKKFISKRKYNAITYSAPSNRIKSYMSYRMITATSSPQYRLQYTKAYSGNYGIRQVRGRYCVAIGSYYATRIGTYFDLVLENGTVIPCILADQKADCDTDASNRITEHDGSLTEFVVDTDGMGHQVKNVTGDISYSCRAFNSPVRNIVIYDKKESF